MKLLITSISDNNIKELTDLTHPFIKKYAEKVNADFLPLTHETDCHHGHGQWHYRIMKHYELFDKYDRILHLDSDVLINPETPNIFNEVPYEKIGTIFEDKGTRKEERLKRIKDSQIVFEDIGWKEGYINSCTFLTSKCHRDIFKKIDGKYYEDWGYDCVHLSYNINKYKFPTHELDYKWNHMTMFSEPWNNNASRFDSYIIHYAGAGIFDGHKFKNRIEQIKNDITKIVE